MKRRIVAAALVLALCLVAIGCAGQPELQEPVEPPAVEQQEQSAEEQQETELRQPEYLEIASLPKAEALERPPQLGDGRYQYCMLVGSTAEHPELAVAEVYWGAITQ